MPLRKVKWAERIRHGVRILHISAGGLLQCGDAQIWDAWRHSTGMVDPLVVRLQQSWRWVLASVAALAVMAVVIQQ